MFSRTTFIGIANATTPSARAAPPAAAPGPAPLAPSGRSANIQPARVLSTPPVAAPLMTPLPRSAMTASPGVAVTPPRNLPRGSLLDISV